MAGSFSWGVGFSGEETGNFLGYGTANEHMRRALLDAGCVESSEADVVVHFCFPLVYEPRVGKINVLFTMYENPGDDHTMRTIFKPAMDQSDLVIVPSAFCFDMLRPYTDTPIEVCPLGVDAATFEYRARRWSPSTPFVWLYCGAINRRKFTILDELWSSLTSRFVSHSLRGRTLLYVKTTGMDLSVDEARSMLRADDVVVFRPPEGEVLVCGEESLVIDNRRLSRKRLAEVYWQAHGALFLHCGEGWGLTGHEALATGLPLVISDYGGTREYASETTAFPVAMRRQRIEGVNSKGQQECYDGLWPIAESAAAQVAAVMADYPAALRVAKAGAERAKALCWEKAGQRLAEILSAL